MSESLSEQYNDAELTPSGARRRVFITDFHGTLTDGYEVRRGYLEAIVKMHMAGHFVKIASGDYMDAKTQIKNSPVVQEVLDGLKLSPQEQQEFKDHFFDVQDKLRIILHLKELGLGKPDVFCDDDRFQRQMLGQASLDPDTDAFDAFVGLARLNPDMALDLIEARAVALGRGQDVDDDFAAEIQALDL
jgi:hypothetical protein